MNSNLNPSNARARKLSHSILMLAGSLSAVLGLLIIIDIHAGTRLVRFAHEGVPLHYNTALGLFALGMGLLGYLTEHFILSFVIGSTMNVFGFFSIVQIFLANELGFQKVLVKSGNIQVSLGAMLSPNTAVCFLLAGLALAMIRRPQKWCATAIGIAAGLVSSVSSVALLGYLTNLSAGYTWGHYTPIPPVAAFAFFTIGVGLYAIAVNEELVHGEPSVRWLPMQVGAGLVLATLVLFSGLVQQEQWRAEKNLRGRISNFKKELEDRFDLQIGALDKLAVKWDAQLKSSQEWETDAHVYMEHFQAYQSIERYSKDLQLRWVSSKDKDEERIQSPLHKEFETQLDFVRRSRAPLALKNEPSERQFKRFRVAVPLFREDRFDGYLVGTFRMAPLVQMALQDEPYAGISFVLSDDLGEIFSRDYDNEGSAVQEEHVISIYGYPWKLKSWPSRKLIQNEKTLLPEAVLFLGVTISCLIAFLMYFSGISAKRTRDLQLSQEETLKAKEEAIRASRSKTEFLANVSHEIRTPMNAIQGMTNLLIDSKLSVEQRDCIDGIKFSADSLLSLINDVLDLAKIEAGKMELESMDFDLRTLLSSIMDLFQLTSQQKGISLKLDYPNEIPAVFKGDPHRLRQVLTNLIGNAVKFTEKGSVKVAVEAVPKAEKNYVVKFLVADTGIGIPDGKKEKMFQSFVQADSSTTRRFGGTGLGLSISKRIIELMYGDIQFDSTENQGSSFWFSIPMEKGDAALVDNSPVFVVKEGSGSKRLLVAEDNSLNRKVAAKVLGRFGYLVDTVSNGREVLAAMESTTYDAILMDCQMPVLDGYQATAAIRKMEENTGRHTPVIALTAHAMVSDRKKCLDAGMDDYIAKPFDPKNLQKVIESLTEKKNKARSLNSHTGKTSTNKLKTKMKRVDVEMLKEVISLKEVDGFAFANELLTIFSKTTPKDIAKLDKALKAKNLPRVVEIAHSMKSGSANLGAVVFHHLCKTLERSARNEEPKRCRKIFNELRLEFSKTDAELRREVKSLFEIEKRVA